MSRTEIDIMTLERDSRALSTLFQQIVNDMKGSGGVWEDFNNKATKLQTALRSTITIISSFLDAFQKVADLANCSRGATRDIGAALTRLCVRHRSIENKMRAFTAAISETVVEPLQMRLEDWKKTAIQLDKDHAKECKKMQQEIKKASSDTLRLQKSSKKSQGDLKHRLDNAMQEVQNKYSSLEETEKRSVRLAMIEERSRFCLFISLLRPLMEQEISMLTEVTHLQEIVEVLSNLTEDPTSLPQSCEQVILDLKGSEEPHQGNNTPPGSPLSLGSHLSSHKSSMCSVSSTSSGSLQSGQLPAGSYSCGNQVVQQSITMATEQLPVPSSTSSHDSGYVSQDFTPVDLEGRTSSFHAMESVLAQNEDGFMSDAVSSSVTFPSPVSGVTVMASWPNSPNCFHYQQPSTTFLNQSSSFQGRSLSISYPSEHSSTRQTFTSLAFELPGMTSGSRCSLQANYDPASKPSKIVEDLDEAEIYARPLLKGQRRQGITACPVAPPTLPVKFSKVQIQQNQLQPVSTNTSSLIAQENSGIILKDENNGESSSSPRQPLIRSFSFPIQSVDLSEMNDQARSRGIVASTEKTIEKDLDVTSESCDAEKSSTLPRMPQFKEPLMPKRYSSTMCRNTGPPTLPKRSSSRLSGKPPPPPPVRCQSAKSGERTGATQVPVYQNPSNFQGATDAVSNVAEIGNVTTLHNARNFVGTDVDIKGLPCSSATEGNSFDAQDGNRPWTPSNTLAHHLRQQAPPPDDSDQLCSLSIQPETVIPLFEEIPQCSSTQLHSPVFDKITIVAPASNNSENMLDLIKRGVMLRKTLTSDRSAPRIGN